MNEHVKLVLNEFNGKLGKTTIEKIKRKNVGRVRFWFSCNTEIMQKEIEQLELSVRSHNCLKRAGYHTIGDLLESITGLDDLLHIRNLGRKSAEEIMVTLFVYQYTGLDPDARECYLKEFAELNGWI